MHAPVEKQASFTSKPNWPVGQTDRLRALLGNISFFGYLGAVLLTAVAAAAADQWIRSFTTFLICFFSALRIIDGFVRRSSFIAVPSLLIPLAGILLIVIIQILPLEGIPALLSGWRNTSAYISIDPYETKNVLLTFAALILLFEGLSRYATTRNRILWIAGTVLLIGLGSAAAGFLPRLLYGDVVASTDPAGAYAYFPNRNHFALLMEMTLGLLLGFSFRGRLSSALTILCWILIVFTGIAIVSSNSRGGIICSAVIVLISVFIYLAQARRRKPQTRASAGTVRPALAVIAVTFVLAVGAVLAIVLIGGDQLVTRFERVGDDIRSADDGRISRVEIWRSTVELIEKYPVAGVGYGAYESGITPFDTSSGGLFRLEQAHNEYLDLAAAGGLPALALAIWCLAALANRVTNRFDEGDRFTRACRFGAAAGILGVLLHSTVDFGLHVLVNAAVFTLLVVLAVSGATESNESTVEGKSHGYLNAFGGVLMLFLSISIGIVSGAQGLSDSESTDPNALAASGSKLFDKGDLSHALAAFDRAIALRPYNTNLFTSRGNVRAALDDKVGAEADLRKGLELAPAYAEPNLHLGRFLLKEGRKAEAFVHLSRAASLNGGLLGELLEHAYKAYPGDAQSFLNAVGPSSPAAKKETVHFLLDRGQFSAAIEPSLISGLDDLSSRAIVNELIQKDRYRYAFELWNSSLRSADIVSDPENLVIAGDFENTVNLDDTFGWQVDDSRDQIAISTASNGGKDESRGLQIRFLGDTRTNDLVLWQLLAIEPGKRYRLRFDVIAEKVESGGLPVVVVLDAASRNVVAESKPISDSAGEWQSFSTEVSSKDSEGLILGVRRLACASGPCPIFGQMRLDNFQLKGIRN